MSVSEILDEVKKLNVMEVVDLVKAMEKEFNVSAAAAVAVAPAAAGGAASGAEAAEAKTEFDVVMTSFGDKKINVIKEVRAITGLPLKEAKDLVEKVPGTIKEGVSNDDAQKLKAQLEAAGATVELK